MVNRKYLAMLDHKSVIRELSEYANARGKEIGYENVFDYSLGNPSVPAPDSYRDISVKLLQEEAPLTLHGYNPTMGDPRVQKMVAESLNKRFDMAYKEGHIFPTSGAAGAIAHALRCVAEPGEEVMVFAPFFSEYGPYQREDGGSPDQHSQQPLRCGLYGRDPDQAGGSTDTEICPVRPHDLFDFGRTLPRDRL